MAFVPYSTAFIITEFPNFVKLPCLILSFFHFFFRFFLVFKQIMLYRLGQFILRDFEGKLIPLGGYVFQLDGS